MNGFLVLLVRRFDSVPVALCRTMKQATRRASSVFVQQEDRRLGPGELGSPGILNRSVGTIIVRFVDGEPVQTSAPRR